MFRTSSTHKIVNQIRVGQISYLDSKLRKYEGIPFHLVETYFSQLIVILRGYRHCSRHILLG